MSDSDHFAYLLDNPPPSRKYELCFRKGCLYLSLVSTCAVCPKPPFLELHLGAHTELRIASPIFDCPETLERCSTMCGTLRATDSIAFLHLPFLAFLKITHRVSVTFQLRVANL